MGATVSCQVQELYDKPLVERKQARVRRILASGEEVRIVVHMQGSQTNNHDLAYVLIEKLSPTRGFVFEPNPPEGYLAATLYPEGGTT
jgi:translation initiation factor IF-3